VLALSGFQIGSAPTGRMTHAGDRPSLAIDFESATYNRRVFTLDGVVPWGRSFDEYRRMFALTDEDLTSRIIGCADGPASFNAEATARGLSATSCDPIYRFTVDQIRQRIRETAEVVLDQTRRNPHEFVWTSILSIEELRQIRMSSMENFLTDFEAGKQQGRYIDAELPHLPFGNASFGIALCSHFLFLYSEQLSEDFHVAAIREMGRIAGEVRVFPLLALGGNPSSHVAPVSERLQRDGYAVSIDTVPYEFQRGGNQMMRVCA
jgi:hypothetical protein